MKIRCPHCSHPIEIVEESSFRDVPCPTCGSSFSLLPDEDTVASPTSSGLTLGRFELTVKLGVGAFGAVWKAVDTELDRTVALKIPRRNQLTTDEMDLFLRETQAAAQLTHPSIVSVHEVGREDDCIFIVSECIDGLTLEDWLSGKQVSEQEAAELVQQVADAVHHAHEHGVIHRDLKPSNIMLDVEGRPHVMDFGLAKRDAAEMTVTMDGRVIGTPAYMSPEQASGDIQATGRWSDVYSLGVVLFRVLTGERPFRGNQPMLLHQVIHDEPPSPRKLNNRISKDMETICLKCLQKAPDQRYPTAAALRDDLRRLLEGKPISARPISHSERVLKWIRRHPAAAAVWLTSALALLALVGAGVSVVYQREVQSMNDRLEIANDGLQQSREMLAAQNATLEEQNKRLQVLRDDANLARNRLARFRYGNDMQLAGHAWQEGDFFQFQEILARHMETAEDIKGWEWNYLQSLVQRSRAQIGGRSACYSPDGTVLAVATDTGVDLVDPDSLQPIKQLAGPRIGALSVAFSGDGRRLIAGCYDNHFHVWNVADGQHVSDFDGHQWHGRAALNHDGSLALTTGLADDRTVKLWRVESGEILFDRRISDGSYAGGIGFTADGNYWAVGNPVTHSVWFATTGNPQKILDLPLPAPTGYYHGGEPAVMFDARSGILYSSYNDTIWSLPVTAAANALVSGADAPPMQATRITGTLLGISPDGTLMATSTPSDHSTSFWHIESQQLLNRIRGQVGDTEFLSFRRQRPGDPLLAVYGSYSLNELRRVNCLQPNEYVFIPSPFSVSRIQYSPDGLQLAAIGYGGNVGIWTGTTWRLLRGASGNPWGLDFAPDGSRLAVTSMNGTGWVWDTSTGDLLHTLQPEGVSSLYDVRYDLNGERLLTTGDAGIVIVWDSGSGQEQQRVQHGAGAVYQAAFHPSSNELVTSSDFRIKYWGEDRFEVPVPVHSDLLFTRDGRQLISHAGRIENELRLVDARTGRVEQEFKGHFATVSACCLFANDAQLVSVGDTNGQPYGTGTLRIWDVATGQETLRLESGGARSVSVSVDGRRIAINPMTGGIRVYSAAPAATP